MNIVKNLVERVSIVYESNKKPCKNYATIERAEKEAEKVSAKASNYFGVEVDYIVFFVPVMSRYCIGFNIQKVILQGKGGYLGICGDHFTF